MPRKSPRNKNAAKPTDSECTILNVIWQIGPATVRDVFNELDQSHGMGYTTVLKFMQIMTEKGLLERDTTVRPQIYRSKQPRARTERALLADLLERAFDGSPGNLALQALSMRKVSQSELRQVRELLDKLEDDG